MGFKLGLIDDCSQCIYKPLKFKFKYLYYVHILCLQQKRYFWILEIYLEKKPLKKLFSKLNWTKIGFNYNYKF